MKMIKKLKAGFLALTLLATLLIPQIAYAAASKVEVDVVVRGEDKIGVENAEVYIYVYNSETELYEEYSGPHISNSSGRVKIEIEEDLTFYAKATDESDNVYADSNYDWANIWKTTSSDSIINVETSSERPTKYVHIYPGLYEAIETPADPTDPTDPSDPSDPDDSSESEDLVIDPEPPLIEDFEVEVTVYDKERNPISEATVSLYFDGKIYSSDTTDTAGRTDEIMAPFDADFYASAEDSEGNKYGGVYDYYFDRENIWTSEDGKTIENKSTGLTRLPYLHLYPAELLPSGYEGDAGEFDPKTYICAGFPDAIYEDLSSEECAAIEYVFAEKIFTGTEKGLIEWDREINRAEATKVLIEFFDTKELEIDGSKDEFPDVPLTGEWYSTYVYQALYNEIVGGYADGFFKPNNTINRVELLRIFIEASNIDYSETPVDYTFWHDVEVNEDSAWYIAYANYAFFNDLLENDGNLNASQAMTRMDVMKLMYRYKGLEVK